MAGEFLDTNVLVYAFTNDVRAAAAQALLERGCATSIQGLNEFANVARRKLGMDWAELHDALAAIRTLCRTIVPLDIEIHDAALRVAARHRYSIFDGLMIAAALKAGSDVLWTEDLQHGAVIDRRLRISNPFRA